MLLMLPPKPKSQKYIFVKEKKYFFFLETIQKYTIYLNAFSTSLCFILNIFSAI